MKILTAIVTHNRVKLLERCIDHVLGQTRPPDGLLVINNGSSDRTVEMLQCKKVNFITQDNVGGAGGWNRAIDEALAGDWDAVWLMDDDGFPEASALGFLEEALVPGGACVSCVVMCEDDPDRFVFPFPVLNDADLPIIVGKRRKLRRFADLRAIASGSTYPFAHLFNGALIRTEAIRKIGNVDQRFFLMGDEVDYFMRLRSAGFVVSDLRARHFHPDVAQRPLNPIKFYYYVKNTLILNRRYFDKILLRDAMAVIAALFRTARRNSLSEAASYLVGRHAPLLWKAVRRGSTGTPSDDFDA